MQDQEAGNDWADMADEFGGTTAAPGDSNDLFGDTFKNNQLDDGFNQFSQLNQQTIEAMEEERMR